MAQGKLVISLVTSAWEASDLHMDGHYHYLLVGMLEAGFPTYQLRGAAACCEFFPPNLDVAIALLCVCSCDPKNVFMSSQKP